MPFGVKQKKSSYCLPRSELRVYSWCACVRVIPSRMSPSVSPEIPPVAAGHFSTNGTGILSPLLVAEVSPPGLDAVTVHVSAVPSSSMVTV